MIFSKPNHAAERRLLKTTVQRGFALVSAIFLLVILAAIGVAMLTLSSVQHQSSALDVMGSRAYQAARAGIEWALYQRLNPQVSNPQQASPPGPAPTYCATSSAAGTTVTNSFQLPAGTSLSTFTVTVKCTATANAPIGVGGPNIVVRTISAFACNQPNGGVCPGLPATSGAVSTNPAAPISDYVGREVQVTLQETL